MDITNATENLHLIRAIRVAYRLSAILPDGWEWVRWLGQAWRDADRALCLELLGYLLVELGDFEGAECACDELRQAIDLAALEAIQRRDRASAALGLDAVA
jgi:hypothetical protein